ncbi:putative ester cyclase [Motilibacter peucedani]|uniref:Putative ester cyclase n=1 Tax=Motilibacter peucedani TaxID=598650 RepID=A0A420XPZ9_9ACTN|nr:ester cyclase [Motilibacter peucedani]RKS75312.1 putative ester cyclase [Motilibacter peucedani]
MDDATPPGASLEQHYRDYIAALDERRFDDLPAYVADELVYNDAPMTLRDYRALLEDDVRRIPDLVYDVRLLVTGEDHVACVLRFDCTPAETFRGLEPTGERIVFTEHVFYRFEDRRIVQVWSLLDLEALERQLARAADHSPPGR